MKREEKNFAASKKQLKSMKKVFKTVSLLLFSASLCGNVFAADDTTLSEMATVRISCLEHLST